MAGAVKRNDIFCILLNTVIKNSSNHRCILGIHHPFLIQDSKIDRKRALKIEQA